jgi:inner membrane protein
VPSVFSHAIVGSTLVACGLSRPRATLVALGAALAVVPDLDVVGLAVGWGLDHPLGHRGLSHSLLAAAGLAAVTTLALPSRPAESRWRLWLVLALAAASHGLLDALTNGGRGVAFFAPFVATRWHFPARPIEVSPIGVWSFFSQRGVEVLANEVVWLWAPSLAALAASWALRRPTSRPPSDRRMPAARAPDR